MNLPNVPSAHQGRVRWTIGDYTDNSRTTVNQEPAQEKVVEKVKSYTRNAFVGVNGCLDFEYASATNSIFYVGLGAGFDFAIPKEKAAIGGMLSLKYCFAGPTNFDLGPLFIFGDYENNTAFMLGAAINLRFATASINYFNINRDLFEKYGCDWVNDKFGVGATLRLGATTLVKRLYFYTDLTLGRYKATYGRMDMVYGPDGNLVMENGRPLTEYKTWKEPHLFFNFALGVGYRF